MIRNVVFDLGGVLLEFEPGRYLEGIFVDGAKSRRILETVFQSELWVELDRGTATAGEVSAILCRRHPALRRDIELAFSRWESILVPIAGTVSILEELGRAGFPLYALSNFPSSAFEKVYRRYPFFKLFDGLVISSKIKRIKPEPEIYRYLLDKYNLKAGETLFIDDRPANLAPAQELGFKTVHFTGPLELRTALVGLDMLS